MAKIVGYSSRGSKEGNGPCFISYSHCCRVSRSYSLDVYLQQWIVAQLASRSFTPFWVALSIALSVCLLEKQQLRGVHCPVIDGKNPCSTAAAARGINVKKGRKEGRNRVDRHATQHNTIQCDRRQSVIWNRIYIHRVPSRSQSLAAPHRTARLWASNFFFSFFLFFLALSLTSIGGREFTFEGKKWVERRVYMQCAPLSFLLGLFFSSFFLNSPISYLNVRFESYFPPPPPSPPLRSLCRSVRRNKKTFDLRCCVVQQEEEEEDICICCK